MLASIIDKIKESIKKPAKKDEGKQVQRLIVINFLHWICQQTAAQLTVIK